MRDLLSKVFFWLPIGAWIGIIFIEIILIKVHVLFYLIVSFLPLISLVLFIYYGLYYFFNRSVRNKWMFLIVLGICLFKYTDHLISIGNIKNKEGVELKVLTWNVQRLGVFSENQNSAENLTLLSAVLDSSNADVVVIQEISKWQTAKLIKQLKLGAGNLQWSNYFKGANGGLALLLLNNKDWTMHSKKITQLPPSWKCVYSEIKHKSGQIINIFGVHIAPPKITDKEVKKAIKNGILGKKKQLIKLLKTYIKQAKLQTQQINKLNVLVDKFKDPTILAGDFNSTYQLPIHKKLRTTLNDAWLEGGNGIGATRYWGNILPFRIDYLYSTKDFKVINTRTENPCFSDHKAVRSHLILKNK